MINTRNQSLNQEETTVRMKSLVERNINKIKVGVIGEKGLMINMETGQKEMKKMIDIKKQKIIGLENIVQIIAEEIEMTIIMTIRDLMKEEANIMIIIEEGKVKLQILIQIVKRGIDIKMIKMVNKIEGTIQDMGQVIKILTIQIKQVGIENGDSQIQMIMTEVIGKVNTKVNLKWKNMVERKDQGMNLTLVRIMFLLKGGMILQTANQVKEKVLNRSIDGMIHQTLTVVLKRNIKDLVLTKVIHWTEKM